MMAAQIVVSLDDDHDLSKSEWKEFVRSQRGKWRGVASDEAVKALLQYMASQDAESDDEKERLRAENDRLSRENERLAEEAERLRDRLNSPPSPGGTPSENSTGTKKKDSESAKIAAPDEQASSPDADEDERDFWATYDPIAEEVTVSEEAVKMLAERDVEDVPGIRRAHVDVEESVPYKGTSAKQALLVGVLRGEAETVREGEILDVAVDLFASSDDPDEYHYRSTFVDAVKDALPVHPDPTVDAWVTTDEAHRRLVEEQEAEAESEAERFVERHVRAALGDPRTMDRMGGPPTVAGMTEAWESSREDVVEAGAIHPVAGKIVAKALRHLEGTSMAGGRLSAVPGIEPWDEFWSEWATDGEALVEWFEREYKDGEVAEPIRDDVVASLEQYVPDEMRLPDDEEETDEEAEGWENVDEAEVEGE